ncbi:MAG: zinc metallopeptidase [Clostridium sp.]|nr:zinc metallopeptidase [Clostridium sp.]
MPFDMLYVILVLPVMLFTIWAQWRVSHNFKKFSKQRTVNNVTGAQAAMMVLSRYNVTGVRIEQIAGNLTDHFDPKSNTIRLSQNVCNVPSVAAVGVAAHEAGHAVQYALGYGPMKIRAAIVPITSIGSKLSLPLVMIGLFFNLTGLINIGILLFGVVAVFQLVTLPVELNASRRATISLAHSQMLMREEIPGAKKVLWAAAMTYVAALALSLVQMLRYILLAARRR